MNLMRAARRPSPEILVKIKEEPEVYEKLKAEIAERIAELETHERRYAQRQTAEEMLAQAQETKRDADISASKAVLEGNRQAEAIMDRAAANAREIEAQAREERDKAQAMVQSLSERSDDLDAREKWIADKEREALSAKEHWGQLQTQAKAKLIAVDKVRAVLADVAKDLG